jgi:hypothetical protein
MLLRSLRALCKASGGAGSIWKYLEALVMATGVSGRFVCGFQTDLYFADEVDKAKSYFIQSARDNIAELYDLDHFESAAEHLEFIDSLLADNKYLFPVAERVESGERGPDPMQRE